MRLNMAKKQSGKKGKQSKAKQKPKQKSKKKPAKKAAKAKRKPSEPVIVPENVIAGLTGEDTVMATSLLELGLGQDVAAIRTATTRAQCVAAGGVVRKSPPWSKLPFVCAKPPSPGLGGGVGAFVTKDAPCAPGYVKVKTKHPFWGKGVFYMCVRPSVTPAIAPGPPPFVPPGLRYVPPGLLFPGGSGLGAVRLLPAEISVPIILLGNGVGIMLSTVMPRGIAAFVKKLETKAVAGTVTKLALGGAGIGIYLLTKKNFTLGLALGTVPGAVESIANMIAGAVEGAAAKSEAKKVDGGSVGQLEPEQIRELEELAEELTGTSALAQYEPEEEEVEEEPISAIPFRTVV